MAAKKKKALEEDVPFLAQEDSTDEPKTEPVEEPAKAEEKKEPVEKQEISYVHVDEFLATKNDLREEVKAGFRTYMRPKGLYQRSRDVFVKELETYFNRKI